MKTQTLISTRGIKFSQLTNKSKRKVYKEIRKRYGHNNISRGIKFDFNQDIPDMASSFFENHVYTFSSFYKMKIYLA